MENYIRKYEKEALAFGREIFGNKLADAVYIKTMGSCQYFGPVFPDARFSKMIKSFLITRTEGKYDFLPSSKLKFENKEEEQSFIRAQGNWWDFIGILRTAFNEGLEERKAKENRATAQRMKADGLPVETIAKYTQLTPEEIETL